MPIYASHCSTPSAFQQVILQKGGLIWETFTELCAHLKTIQFSSERREKTLLNLKKNDNIMWRQCAEKIDFYQEVLLLEGLRCSPTWLQLGLFSRALVLILHFQPPLGSDGDNKTKKRFQAWEEKRVTVSRRKAFSVPTFDPDPLGVVVHI